MGLGKSGTASRRRVPRPPARMMAVVTAISDRIHDSANLVHFLVAQVRKIADIETVEMDMFDFGKVAMVALGDDALQIGLAYLIAAAGAAAAELDAGSAH